MSEQNNVQINILKEYDELRDEIKQKIELHNSLITFMITTVVAVLAFALDNDNSLLYLLPFAIIIPISMRITYYRSAMVKLSAYIIVYIENEIEGLYWETRNTKLINDDVNNFYNRFTISHYYEGIILSVVCYVLYFKDYIKDKTINFQTILFLFIPLVFVIWEGIITKRIITFNDEKNDWIEKWIKFKVKNK